MFNKKKGHDLSSHTQPSNSRLDMASFCPRVDLSRLIDEANQAKSQLSDFMGSSKDTYKFVSLGENCSSAWYLKQLGLKEASYPFDWIFSSPDIVVDCIDDGFAKYLDKKLITPKNDDTSAGHSWYHDSLFNHRNPLASDEEYNYHKRCCNRFTELIEQKYNTCYLITLINEPSKRPGWAKGFNKEFSMPENQNLETVSKLFERLKDRNSNSKFVVVDHYTNSEKPTVSKKISDSIFFVEFHARDKSTGVYYPNLLDDFRFKLLLTGLYGPRKDS